MAAILCDENRIASWIEMPPATRSIFCRVPTNLTPSGAQFSQFMPKTMTLSNLSPPSASIAMTSSNTAITCFWCGQLGHLRPECPKCFNIQYMNIKKKQVFAEDVFAALDVAEAGEKVTEMVEDEVTPGFGHNSE